MKKPRKLRLSLARCRRVASHLRASASAYDSEAALSLMHLDRVIQWMRARIPQPKDVSGRAIESYRILSELHDAGRFYPEVP